MVKAALNLYLIEFILFQVRCLPPSSCWLSVKYEIPGCYVSDVDLAAVNQLEDGINGKYQMTVVLFELDK